MPAENLTVAVEFKSNPNPSMFVLTEPFSYAEFEAAGEKFTFTIYNHYVPGSEPITNGKLEYAGYLIKGPLSAQTQATGLQKVIIVEDIYPTSLQFNGCTQLESIEGLDKLHTDNVTNMNGMFSGCARLTTLDLSNFDTAKVTDMSSMFNECSSLTKIIVSDKFVTTSVTSSTDMFYGCTSLVGGAGTEFDGNNATDATYARIDSAANPGYFTGDGTSGTASTDVYWVVTDNDTVLHLYGSAGSGRNGPLDQDARANSYEMDWVEYSESVSLIVVEDPIAPTCMNGWFSGFTELVSIEGMSNIKTANVTDMAYLFWNCPKLASVDVSGFNTAKVTTMAGMFAGIAATELDLSSFDTSQVTNMSSMFGSDSYYSDKLITIYVSDSFVTTGLGELQYTEMFYGYIKLEGGNETAWDSEHVTAEYARIDAEGTPGYFTRKPSAP